jgi:hypothetical protein
MRRATPDSLHDRAATLEQQRAEAESEALQLDQDERALLEQVRQAQEQVRYYENLLIQLRRDWGASPPLARLVRKLG